MLKLLRPRGQAARKGDGAQHPLKPLVGDSPSAPSPPVHALRGKHDSLLMIITGLNEQPDSGRLLRGLTPYLDREGSTHVFLLTERKRWVHWRDEAQAEFCQELVYWNRNEQKDALSGVCSSTTSLDHAWVLERFAANPLELLPAVAERLGAALISSTQPLRLQNLVVEKPWGRERWYTGVERRGVCTIASPTGETELPHALGMFPQTLLGRQETDLILLKTLEPRPEPVLGDLYLEVHEEKWETYLVLKVDRTAWPDGTGQLRAGIDANMLKHYHKKHGKNAEQHLIADLEQKIGAYEKIRRTIDSQVDKHLKAKKLPLDQPAPVEFIQEALAELPERLIKSEAKLRKATETFIGCHPLREGDVTCLPPGILHALQHGIKVVEFQTPTYERLIAMYAQKVITQKHWDTKKALEWMDKTPYQPPATTALFSEQKGVRREQVVAFPQFHVIRTRLAPGTCQQPIAAEDASQTPAYRLLFITQGKGKLVLADKSEWPLAPEEAWLLPVASGDYEVHSAYRKGLSYLECHPYPATAP